MNIYNFRKFVLPTEVLVMSDMRTRIFSFQTFFDLVRGSENKPYLQSTIRFDTFIFNNYTNYTNYTYFISSFELNFLR